MFKILYDLNSVYSKTIITFIVNYKFPQIFIKSTHLSLMIPFLLRIGPLAIA